MTLWCFDQFLLTNLDRTRALTGSRCVYICPCKHVTFEATGGIILVPVLPEMPRVLAKG